ncbi:hypothetical protein HAX54_004226 [Datura stramonium]|uniref:Uncharacterized protein n=1 Tax=Datura stramonium TaxID=4076 RepID=A0ABS8T7Q6_DATST|nr:hypothetical protein [Datura stramonium]
MCGGDKWWVWWSAKGREERRGKRGVGFRFGGDSCGALVGEKLNGEGRGVMVGRCLAAPSDRGGRHGSGNVRVREERRGRGETKRCGGDKWWVWWSARGREKRRKFLVWGRRLRRTSRGKVKRRGERSDGWPLSSGAGERFSGSYLAGIGDGGVTVRESEGDLLVFDG